MSLPRRSAAVLLTALLLQATSLPYFHSAAHAQSAQSLVVLPFVNGKGAPDTSAERFRGLLDSELRKREGLSLAAAPKAPAPSATPAKTEAAPVETANAADASAILDEGQQKLADLQFEAAAELLRDGIARMTAKPETIDWARLIDAHVSLAVASFRRGDEEGAQKALGTVVRLSPDFALPEGRYPPIFVRELDKAKRRAEKLPKGAIHVDGPPGAVASVDGRDLGMVPVVEEGLTPGVHYVRVEGTRGEPFGAVVELRGKEAKVTASFGASATRTPIAGRSAGASSPNNNGSASPFIGPVLDASAHARAHTAAEAAGTQFAIVGVIYRSGDHQLTAATALYSTKARGFVALPQVAVDEGLLTANVEIYRLSDAVEQSVKSFGRPLLMGHDLASGATWQPGAVAAAPREIEVPVTGGRRSALEPGREPQLAEDEGRLRALEGGSIREDLARDPREGAPGEVKSKSKWWVWTLVGVGVVAAAGGTAYGVQQATQPVTGTVTARW